MFLIGKRYNIPVCLWLNESYPRSAPICYVKPTRDMMIVSSRHVNSNGEIMLPYLDEWRHVRGHMNWSYFKRLLYQEYV